MAQVVEATAGASRSRARCAAARCERVAPQQSPRLAVLCPRREGVVTVVGRAAVLLRQELVGLVDDEARPR